MTRVRRASVGRMVRRLARALAAAALLSPAGALAHTATWLQGFDQQAYDTRVLPAFGAFVRMHDAKPLEALLRDTIRRLRSNPFPPDPGREPPTANELAIALEIMQGSTAHDRTHLNLVVRGQPVTRADAIRQFVTTTVFRRLLDAICPLRVDGVVQTLNLWESRLGPYLYERSRWIEDEFHGMQPPRDFMFEFGICQGTGAIPPWFVDRFLTELRRVPRPPPDRELQREYDVLLQMLERVRADPAYRLVVTDC